MIEQEKKAGGADAPPAADEAKVPAPPKLLGTLPREKVIDLQWPVEYDGVVYDKVTIRRLTGKETRDFMDLLSSGGKTDMPPMIDVPLEVYEAMDADDQYACDEAAMDFLPRALREASDLALEAMKSTALSSPAP
ncbi:MAG: phage tail assembly protein [Salinarimonadaceae bacterium]|nr:MAG: phage tail assembly protein [Salinarimonadaceae bacterium]